MAVPTLEIPSNGLATAIGEDAIQQSPLRRKIRSGTNNNDEDTFDLDLSVVRALASENNAGARPMSYVEPQENPRASVLEQHVNQMLLDASAFVADDSSSLNNGSSSSAAIQTRRQQTVKRRQTQRRVNFEAAPEKPRNIIDNDSDEDEQEEQIPEKALNIDKLFIQIGDDVKKVSFKAKPPLKAALHQLFSKKFNFKIDGEEEEEWPPMYIKDAGEDTFYELEQFSSIAEKATIKLKIAATGEDDPRAKYGKGTSSGSNFKRLLKEMNMIKDAVMGGSRDAEAKRKAAEALLSKQLEISREKRRMLLEKWKQQDACLKDMRRQLVAAKQLHTDLHSQSRASIAEMRTQLTAMSKLIHKQTKASIGLSDERIFLNQEKAAIESESVQLRKVLDRLQDQTKVMSEDWFKRRSRPSEAMLKTMWKDLEDARTRLDTHADRFTKDAKQAWKKQWEKELQFVVQEQKLLKEQEAVSGDLDDDFAQLEEALQALALGLKQKGGVEFIPADLPDDIAVTDLKKNLLGEIESVKADSSKRLAAAEQAAKRRAELLSLQRNDFEVELEHFVGDHRLRGTGGWEAAERQRQERDRELLNLMKQQPTKET